LASAVAFRGERIIVGDKARELLEKDPLNVFICFKRRMGTTDEYYIESRQKHITPIELSTYVLKELINFIHSGETLREVVITIPSSFDTIQSNATKTAGLNAGFKNVYLLQEPVAASLAFANKNDLVIEDEKKWLVYDYGGGTFDVALLAVTEREMNILDNEGDNFLGGMDFDNLIIEKIIVPILEKELSETKLWEQFKTTGNQYQKTYFELLFKAEEAKKELSRFERTEIDVDILKKDFHTTITVTRQQFNDLITPSVKRTIDLAETMLERTGYKSADIEKLVMVGGSTLIPYVREQLVEKLGIPIDTSVEPTAAVGIGAAYYAGAKLAQEDDVTEQTIQKTEKKPFEIYYQRNSKDLEELISVKGAFPKPKAFYRITRNDGGYDTGLVEVNDSVSCFVDILAGEKNSFSLKIFDEAQSEIFQSNSIVIIQGKYNIQGQLLPSDICLEIDDIEHGLTRLEAIFEKNTVLPLKKTIYKTATKNILRGSDEKLQINIVEGDDNGLPSSGLSIGFIEISGKDLEQDLIKGTDIEIELALSESRDLDINVFLNACDQEFQNIFKPTKRYISAAKINKEIEHAVNQIEKELQLHGENYELLGKFKNIREALIELQIELSLLSDGDSTDTKFKIDNTKRTLIKQYDQLTRYKELGGTIDTYQMLRAQLRMTVLNTKEEFYKIKFEKIITHEKEFLNSGNKYLIKSKIKELEELDNQLFNDNSKNFIGLFVHYKGYSAEYTDQQRSKNLIKAGDKALDKNQYDVIKQVVYQLHALLPEHLRNEEKQNHFDDSDKTGLK